MNAAVPNTSRITFWKWVILAVCVCVFLFGLQAKLAQYQAPSPNVAAVSSAKLWLGDHRMEVQSMFEVTLLLSLAVMLFFHLSVDVSIPLLPLSTPAPVQITRLWQLRRFFRPPPAR